MASRPLIGRTHLGEMVRFALVGGSGTIVNLVVYVGLHKILTADPTGIVVPLPPTEFNVRWYHVFSSLAFIAANAWNFEINRVWTFRTGARARRSRFSRFFTIGLIAHGLGLLVLTALVHPHSPVALPTDVLDGSTGFRTPTYWAQVIAVVCVTPLSFLLNRLWTFKEHRRPVMAVEARSDVS